MTTIRGLAVWVCVIAAAMTFVGCAKDQLNEELFQGTWTLDVERTNAVNGFPAGPTVPPELLAGILGKAWRLDADGALQTDLPTTWGVGSWRLAEENTIIINEGNGEQQYAASFHDGYMYLKKKTDGKTLVLKRKQTNR